MNKFASSAILITSTYIRFIFSLMYIQALAKDLPWKLKESRVAEILEAVITVFLRHCNRASRGYFQREMQFPYKNLKRLL